MATGDQADFLFRLKSLLPFRWFPTTAPGATSATPILDAVLSAPASAFAYLYGIIVWAKAQMRMATASGVGLDMIGLDYFGLGLPRKVNESDAAFLRRLKLELMRPRGTRAALAKVLTDLTGRAPWIFEPARSTDTGGWGNTGMTAGTGLGYGAAGGYGSLMLPFQAFVIAYRPIGGGVASVMGFQGNDSPAVNGYWSAADHTANMTFSGGFRTATATVNASFGEGARATVPRTTGRYHLEMTIGAAAAGGNVVVGIATGAAVIASNSFGVAIVMWNTGTTFTPSWNAVTMASGASSAIKINNVTMATDAGAIVAGNVIAIEVDLDAQLIWFKNLSVGGTAGQWNLNLNGNPAAGTGGISFAALGTSGVYPVIAGVTGAVGALGTLNEGTVAFTGTPSAGFSAYWSTLNTAWAGGGYGLGAMEYAGSTMISAAVSDTEIYTAIARTMPVATEAWTQISS